MATQILHLNVSSRTMKALLLLTVAGLLSGCGASTKSREVPSTGIPGGLTTSTGSGTGAECNAFDSASLRLQGRVTTFYENRVLQEDRVRLRITGIDDRFENSSNVMIRMFRWKVDATGKSTLDSTPLDFRLEKSGAIVSNTMNAINVTQVASLRQSAGVSGTTSNEFFSATNFVVLGVDFNWQALKIVLYDGTTILGEANLLLPVFTADPNKYAATHAGTLAQLHPFWSQRTQSSADSYWVERARSFCF